MFLTSALIVAVAVGAGSGLLTGLANKKQADQQREQLELQRKALRAQLERKKSSYRGSAQDTSSYYTLNMNTAIENLEGQLEEYDNQVNLYASQATRSVGSARANAGMTGFRNSGSNLNAEKNTASDVLSQMKSVYANIAQAKLSAGTSVTKMQTNTMANLYGYQQSVQNAIAQTNEKLERINLQDDQLGYKEWGGWKDILLDTGVGALKGGANYITSGLSQGASMFGEGSWAWA